MKSFDAALKKMRGICLSLPDTKETPTWGKPHFRVGEKIFSGLGEEAGVLTVGFKLEMEHAEAIVRRSGFSRAPYVGHKGWVSAEVGVVTDWDELRALIHESYRLIAAKKTLAKWEPDSGSRPARKPVPRKRNGGRRKRSSELSNTKAAGRARTR